MKTFGPTNPGNEAWENDSGVIGALFHDPNTLVNAAGRNFFDCAFVGKFQASWRTPRAAGGLEVAASVLYLGACPIFG